MIYIIATLTLIFAGAIIFMAIGLAHMARLCDEDEGYTSPDKRPDDIGIGA